MDNTRNATKYGLLSLAIKRVIPVVDRRLVLSDKEDEDQTNDIGESDLSKEKDNSVCLT